MATRNLVGVSATFSPKVRRLCRMRAAELELSISQYLAALVISDTKHLVKDEETEEANGQDGDAA